MSGKLKVLLKIGYDSYLLPDDAGVQTVLKTLQRALKVRDRVYAGEIQLQDSEPIELAMSYVPAKTRFLDEDGTPVQEARKKGPPRLALKAHHGALPLPERSVKDLFQP